MVTPLMILDYFILNLFVVVGVAFITLFERKILGCMHLRKGPDKVSLSGLLQPFSDALKLVVKEKSFTFFVNKFIYSIMPFFSFILMLLFWVIFFWGEKSNMVYSFLFFILISSLGVYVVMLGGWSSNSKYSLLGSYRGVAQTVSYEVSMTFFVLGISLLSNSFCLFNVLNYNKYCSGPGIFFLFYFCSWVLIIIAETNRAPFDFAEGESELVSGFNVEYGAGNFAFLFLAEYGNIFFMCYISSVFFFSKNSFLVIFLVFIFIWFRGTFPRFRYDNFMMFSWKSVLPFSMYGFYLMFLINFF